MRSAYWRANQRFPEQLLGILACKGLCPWGNRRAQSIKMSFVQATVCKHLNTVVYLYVTKYHSTFTALKCLYVLLSALSLSCTYCTLSVDVLTLSFSRVCNSSGRTRKRIRVSMRTTPALLGLLALQPVPKGRESRIPLSPREEREQEGEVNGSEGNIGKRREWKETDNKG